MENFQNSKNGIYGFPSHDVDPAEKVKKDWCVQFCKAIDSLYRNNLTGITYSDVDLFATYRAYGSGNQSKIQYMDRLGITKQPTPSVPQATTSQNANPPAQPSDFVRKGFMNIDWSILSVAPNFKNIVLGTFEDVDHEIFADGVDEKSSALREEMKWGLWMENVMKEYMTELEATVGISSQPPDYIPKTMQELQMFADLGGFKLKSEISIEEGIRYTLFLSEWKELRRKLIEDAFDLGVFGVKDYLDPMTKKVRARYCDPALCVIPYNRQQEYSDMPFAGEYVFYTIAELRALNDIDGNPQFTEEQLKEIANKSTNQYGNPTIINNYQVDLWGRYEYDTFRVSVLDGEFKSDDVKYTTEKLNDDGTKVVYNGKFGKVRNSDKRKTHKTKTLMVYKCKWIIGTEYAWDYGHQFDIPRPTPSQANLSFHFYRIKSGSLIKRMIPLLDSIQLSWLKLQNAKAKARPSGLAIEYGSLLNISIGNQKMEPLDILRISNQTGDVLYQASTHRSYMPASTNYKPIQELQGGLGKDGMEFINLMNSDIEMIRQIIGINGVADASSPAPDQLVGVSQIALQATNTALRPLYSGYVTLKERLCKNIALRIQLIVKFNKEYELSYFKAFGKSITETLKIGAEINNAMFGIRIEARPSQEEKQQILNTAAEAMRVGRQGVPVIGFSDYLMVEHFLSLGMTKWARAYIAYKEQEAEAKQQQQSQAAIEQQGQVNKELEMIKGQQQQQKTQAETEKITLQSQMKREEMQLEHDLSMQRLQREKTLDVNNALTEKIVDNHQADKEQDKELAFKEQELKVKEKEKKSPDSNNSK